MAGIEVGDRVIAFDSKKASPANLAELVRLIKDDDVKSFEIELEHRGTTRKMTIVKAMLF